jgi:peptidoglycan/LPS O-acetylase OafA/YrhL
MGAIRLFLALAVMFTHLADETFPEVTPGAERLWFGVRGGWAVMMFFAVSGFLMSFVLDKKYGGPRGIWSFYRGRFLRIYPLWWATLAIVLTTYPIVEWRPYPSALDIVATVGLIGADWRIALTSYPEPHSTFPSVLGLGWSIAVELSFYLIAPFAFRSIALAIGLFGASVAMRMLVLDHFQFGSQWLCLAYYFAPTLLPFFLLGHFSRKIWLTARFDNRWGALLFPMSLICIHRAQGFDSSWFYLSIACFSMSLPPIFALTKNNRLMNFAGDLTYPLYLSHFPVIRLLSYGSPETLGEIKAALSHLPISTMWQFVVMAAGSCFILLPLAYVIHRCIERPTRRLFETILDHRGWHAVVTPINPSHEEKVK